MKPVWHVKWFQDESQASAFSRRVYPYAWGVEQRKVNARNQRHADGFTVRWRWRSDEHRKKYERAYAL